ncbi:hypothetical protein BvRS1_07230 [Burkholderia vietnamiensis]|nr:hypothetical protein BvRS1_07230 [Burkholderia vietnamiensis]
MERPQLTANSGGWRDAGAIRSRRGRGATGGASGSPHAPGKATKRETLEMRKMQPDAAPPAHAAIHPPTRPAAHACRQMPNPYRLTPTVSDGDSPNFSR